MSIYSGFATRQQQTLYDETIVSLLKMLCRRLIKFYEGEYSDDKSFASAVTKAHRILQRNEKHKYLEPKVSLAMDELSEYLRDKIIARSDAADKSTSKIVNTSQKSDKSGDYQQTGIKEGLQVSRVMVAAGSGKVMGVVSATSRGRLSTGHRVELKPEITGIVRPSTHHNTGRPISHTAAINYPINTDNWCDNINQQSQPSEIAACTGTKMAEDQILSKYLKGHQNYKPNFPQRCFKAFRSKTKRQPQYTML